MQTLWRFIAYWLRLCPECGSWRSNAVGPNRVPFGHLSVRICCNKDCQNVWCVPFWDT